MPINFPDNPEVNDSHQVNGRHFIWNGSKWRRRRPRVETAPPSLAVEQDFSAGDALHVDSTNSSVGIGTATPNASDALTVGGDTTITGNMDVSGYITVPTQSSTTNDTKVATTAFVQTAISDLIGGAPSALDTLNELAAAINDDSSYAASITNALSLKQDSSTALTTSTTFGGDVSGTYDAIVISDDSHNHTIANIDNLQTTLDGKAASSHTHSYAATSHTHSYLPLSGGTMTADLYISSGSSANAFRGGLNYWRPQDAYGNSYFDINNGQFYVDSDTYYFRNRASTNSLVIDSSGNGTFTGTVSASRLQVGGHYIDDVAGSGNPYGSINVGGAMTWDGYAIDQRVVFMHDGGSYAGLYNDVNNHWMVYCTLNGGVDLRYQGATKLYTDGSGAVVNGRLHATDLLYVGNNGSGDSWLYFYDDNSNAWREFGWDDSENRFRSSHNIKFDGYVHSSNNFYVGDNGKGDSDIYFYDDNSNTWRTMRWDDSVNDWAVEDNGGTMRKLYHSGNIPSYAASSHTHYIDAWNAGRGLAYSGATVGGGSANLIGFRWASPFVNCTVDNVIAAGCANFSDIRLKTEIADSDAGLGIVNMLRPVTYRPLDVVGFDQVTGEPEIGEGDAGDYLYGFIADEVQNVFPSAVRGEGIELKSIDSVQLLSVVVKALQEIDSRLAALEAN